MKRTALIVGLLLPLVGLTAVAAAPSAASAEGELLRATGSGAPNLKASTPAQARLGAERAAKMDAFRNLLEQVNGLELEGGVTVDQALNEHPELRAKVQGVIRGYEVLDTRYFSDGAVEIDVAVPASSISKLFPKSDAGSSGRDSGSDAGSSADGPTRLATGVVIDASALDFTPSAAFKVVDPEGALLYCDESVPSERIKARGLASFFRSAADAGRAGVVGAEPLSLQAIAVRDGALVLSAESVELLRQQSAADLEAIVAAAKVAVVVP